MGDGFIEDIQDDGFIEDAPAAVLTAPEEDGFVEEKQQPQNFFEGIRDFFVNTKKKQEEQAAIQQQQQAAAAQAQAEEDANPATWSSTRFAKEYPKPQTMEEKAIYDAILAQKKEQEKKIIENIPVLRDAANVKTRPATEEENEMMKRRRDVSLARQYPTDYTGGSIPFDAFMGVERTPGTREAYPVEAFVGDITRLFGASRAAAGVAPVVARSAVFDKLPNVARFIGARAAHTGAAFGLKKTADELMNYVFQDRKDLSESAKEIASDVAFGAGIGAVGAIPKFAVRLPSEIAYGFTYAKMQGADNLSAGVNGALFGLFGLLNRENYSDAMIKEAMTGFKKAVVDRAIDLGHPEEKARQFAEVASKKVEQEVKARGGEVSIKDLQDLAKGISEGGKIVFNEQGVPATTTTAEPSARPQVKIEGPVEGAKPSEVTPIQKPTTPAEPVEKILKSIAVPVSAINKINPETGFSIGTMEERDARGKSLRAFLKLGDIIERDKTILEQDERGEYVPKKVTDRGVVSIESGRRFVKGKIAGGFDSSARGLEADTGMPFTLEEGDRVLRAEATTPADTTEPLKPITAEPDGFVAETPKPEAPAKLPAGKKLVQFEQMDKDSINALIGDIQEMEARRRVGIEDVHGEEKTIVTGHVPEYLKNQGVTKAGDLPILNKVLKGEPLTPKQHERVLKLINLHIEELERQLGKPIEELKAELDATENAKARAFADEAEPPQEAEGGLLPEGAERGAVEGPGGSGELTNEDLAKSGVTESNYESFLKKHPSEITEAQYVAAKQIKYHKEKGGILSIKEAQNLYRSYLDQVEFPFGEEAPTPRQAESRELLGQAKAPETALRAKAPQKESPLTEFKQALSEEKQPELFEKVPSGAGFAAPAKKEIKISFKPTKPGSSLHSIINDAGKNIGQIGFTVKNGEAFIELLDIDGKFRTQGYGRAAVKKILNRPDVDIVTGQSANKISDQFWEALGAEPTGQGDFVITKKKEPPQKRIVKLRIQKSGATYSLLRVEHEGRGVVEAQGFKTKSEAIKFAEEQSNNPSLKAKFEIVGEPPSGTAFAASSKPVTPGRTAGGKEEGWQPKVLPQEKIAKYPPQLGGMEYVRALEMPELVRLAKQISGNTPQVVRKTGEAYGRFIGRPGSKGNIKLIAELFKDPDLAAGVLAHEIGHNIDWLPDETLKRGNVIGRAISHVGKFMNKTFGPDLFDPDHPTALNAKELRKELEALTVWWHPFEPVKGSSFTKYRFSSKELYAEFLSVLLNAPAKAQEIAPKFYNAFFEHLDKKPDVHQAFFELQEILGEPSKVLKQREEDIVKMFEKSRATFENILNQKTAAKKSLRFLLRYHFVDRHAGVLDARNKAAKGKLINPEDDPKYLLEENSMIGSFVKSHLDELDVIYQELRRSDIDFDKDFGQYIFLKRVMADRAELANPLGQTPETAARQLESMKERLGTERFATLEGFVTRAREWFKGINDLLKEDILTPEQIETVEGNNEYAPFRVTKYLKEYASAKFAHQIGTLNEIENPGASMVLKGVAMLRLYKRNQIEKKIGNFLVDTGNGESATVKIFDKQVHIEPKEGLEPIKWREGGKWKAANVDPYIADSFKYDDSGVVQSIGEVFQKILLNNALFRPVYITFNLGFQSFNLLRDFQRYWKNTPGLTFVQAIKNYSKAFPHAVARIKGTFDPLIQEMERESALNITMNDMIMGKEKEDTEIDALLSKYGMRTADKKPNPILRPLIKIMDGIKFAGDVIETIPKVAGRLALEDMNPTERAYYIRITSAPRISR